MKERKHIDRLYQEKFKDFEATPHEAVWKSISAKLREKEQRRPVVAPIWSRIAGIAAILTLIFFIGDWMFPVSTRSTIASEEIEKSFLDNPFSIVENSLTNRSEKLPEEIPASKTPSTISSTKKESTSDAKVTPLETPLNGETITSGENRIAVAEVPEKTLKNEPVFKKKSIFEEIQGQEKEIAEESSKGDFEVSTHAAPIYYGNFGKGNFLDPQFNNNSNESEVTYSYGINIAYSISDKVKIRSGVNKVSMSYNTNGIEYHAVVNPSSISSIAYNDNSKDILEDGVANKTGNTRQPLANNTRSSIGSVNSGLLNQKMGFIEVPVELEYNLINKRFELNIIGGASTLFLDENKISVNSGNISAVGKANNLNQISFSTNIGLGLDYNLSEKFKLNMEPMLKYQVNTFSSPSSDNQPYYLGIYSGFSFKF